MHAVVNHLRFRDPIDPAVFGQAEHEIGDAMRAIPGFAGASFVQTSATDAILVIRADDAGTLDRIATEVGSPWMVANVVPLLAAPPDRHVGAIVGEIAAS